MGSGSLSASSHQTWFVQFGSCIKITSQCFPQWDCSCSVHTRQSKKNCARHILDFFFRLHWCEQRRAVARVPWVRGVQPWDRTGLATPLTPVAMTSTMVAGELGGQHSSSSLLLSPICMDRSSGECADQGSPHSRAGGRVAMHFFYWISCPHWVVNVEDLVQCIPG